MTRNTATLVNSNRQTVYKIIKNGILIVVNISEHKTLIKRSAKDKLYELQHLQRTITKSAAKGTIECDGN